MNSERSLPAPVVPGQRPSVLAPMQDVTTLPFMRLVARYGAPDWFVTEYFRVHETSRLEPHILASITENDSGRPVFAQLIGEDLQHLRRTVEQLQAYPIAGIDLNLGCPAPKVYRKNVGGGLLRDPQRIDEILTVLRGATAGRLTVKMRVGFDGWEGFDRLLDLVTAHEIQLVTVHGRTVREMYRSTVHYDLIARGVARSRVPVLANGDVTSAAKAAWVIAQTGAYGVMIGRHAIRNPWIFRQWRELQAGVAIFQPTLGEVRQYIDDLWVAVHEPAKPKKYQLGYLKKFLNFIGQSVDPEGGFLHEMRRAVEPDDLWRVCDAWLVRGSRALEPYPLEPFPGVIARPSREAPRDGEESGSEGLPELEPCAF